MYFSFSICIRYRNTTAFLSSVLQCKKSIINGWCNISAIHIIGSKHTAFFTQSCCYFFKFTHKCRLHSFQIFHLSKLSLKSILLYQYNTRQTEKQYFHLPCIPADTLFIMRRLISIAYKSALFISFPAVNH